MTRHRRRAFTIVELLALLPMIAAVSIVAFQVVVQAIRVSAHEHRLMTDDVVRRDLIRRIQRDAGRADAATVKREDAGVELQLVSADRTVSYQALAGRVTRTERTDSEPMVRYDWTLDSTRVDFQLEPSAASPGLVWVLFSTVAPEEQGSISQPGLSAAATVGRGGAS